MVLLAECDYSIHSMPLFSCASKAIQTLLSVLPFSANAMENQVDSIRDP
jgi:hypothetical protein